MVVGYGEKGWSDIACMVVSIWFCGINAKKKVEIGGLNFFCNKNLAILIFCWLQ